MQDPSGGAAREALTKVLQRLGDQLSSSKGRSELHNPLSMGEALPLLPLSRPLFAGKQCLRQLWHLFAFSQYAAFQYLLGMLVRKLAFQLCHSPALLSAMARGTWVTMMTSS